MGCCQTNLGQTTFGFTAQGLKFETTSKMLPKEIITDKKEISGENFIRISIYHKTLGKEHFMKKEYPQAIAEFTKAINYCPQISIYYSNRALCYKAQHEWTKALEDSRDAIALDDKNIKALDIMAEALIELERKDARKTVLLKEAVKCLEKAYAVAFEKKGDDVAEAIVKELDIKLKRARKMLYLKSLNTEDPKREELSKFVRNLVGTHEKDENIKAEVLELFNQLKKEREQSRVIDIPDYLNCKISYEIMKDPKVTPDGISYEGSVLNEHFVRVGYFDPVTRREVDSTMLLANNNLKKAIDHFYKQHPDHFEPEKKNFLEIEI